MSVSRSFQSCGSISSPVGSRKISVPFALGIKKCKIAYFDDNRVRQALITTGILSPRRRDLGSVTGTVRVSVSHTI
jgi:hypothetical protein